MPTPKFYITTAIDYANGVPHIGHAYEKILADAIARFKRCAGYGVHFLTGTDEYGLKMSQTALLNKLLPTDLADKNALAFRHMSDALNISYNDFVRTTEPRHHKTAINLWNSLKANGDIYKSLYTG